jgi:hypothetical protein
MSGSTDTRLKAVATFTCVLLLCASTAQCITILDGPLTNTSYPTTKFSRWIGNFTLEQCDDTVAPLVTVLPEHNLCTLSSHSNGKYVGKIIFVESLVIPAKSNMGGCAFEERYLQAEQAGAVGVVDYRYRAAGQYSMAHTNGYTPNEGSIPLVSVGKEFVDIANALIKRDPSVEGLLIQLSCSSENENDIWVYTIAPVFSVVMGSLATYSAFIALREYRRARAEQKRGRTRSKGIQMRTDVLLLEGIIMGIVGPLQFLGLNGRNTHSPFLGDIIIGTQIKLFFEQQFVGASFFTSFLLALFWLELRTANRELRPLEYAPGKHKFAVAIAFLFTMFPPLYFAAALAFQYESPSRNLETPILFLLNLILASFFLYQTRSAMKDFKKVIAYSQKLSGGTTDESLERTAHLVRHVGKWMSRFGVFVLVQALGLVVLRVRASITTTNFVLRTRHACVIQSHTYSTYIFYIFYINFSSNITYYVLKGLLVIG